MQDFLRFVRQYAIRHWRSYAFGLGALLLTNVLSVLIPGFIAAALRSVDPGGAGLPPGDGAPGRWILLIVGVSIGIIFVRTVSRVLIFNPGRVTEFEMRNDYFEHLLNLPPSFFRRYPVGELMSRGSHDMQFIRVLVGFAGLQVVNIAIAVPLNLWRMIVISPWLTMGCVVPLVLATLVARRGIRSMLKTLRASQEEVAALSDEILETYNGIRVVHAYAAERALLARFDHRNDRYANLLVRIGFLRSFLLPVITVVGNLSLLVLLWFGGRAVANGSLHYGDVSAFSVYVGNIVGALTSFGWVINVIQRGQVSLRRVYEILEATPGHPEVKATLPEGPLSISVSHLTYRYPTAEGAGERAPSLVDVSFELRAGQTLGIFGATGSGKTTLLRLLTRLETPPPATVYIGGVDVCDVEDRELRRALAIAPQSAHLFSRSVAENVALGDSSRAATLEQIETALANACMLGEARALPGQLDTVVGERGVTLSGGQRQRTALARAFFRAGRILMLDDVLSAVDHDTEQRLIATMQGLGAGRTTIIVSHRISALRHADRVIVLDEGRVVDSGCHDELITRGGLYAHAWDAEEAAARQDAPLAVAHG